MHFFIFIVALLILQTLAVACYISILLPASYFRSWIIGSDKEFSFSGRRRVSFASGPCSTDTSPEPCAKPRAPGILTKGPALLHK